MIILMHEVHQINTHEGNSYMKNDLLEEPFTVYFISVSDHPVTQRKDIKPTFAINCLGDLF